ncbi:MAG TPA: SDR family oxidoreductase [Byssovorax sp.]|jgi:NAD(P)-dependent dehydrogenase (short-subunit alcohol dehydrogenase family)
MGELDGKVCIVTGANTGIGRAAAHELARRGAHVFVGSRSKEKGDEAVDAIRNDTGSAKVEHLALDLGSFDAVRAAAKTFLARDLPLPILINNAGVAGQRGETKDGFELHFGTNHLGHFLFTALLIERIRKSGPARIVHVSSKSHYDAKGIDFDVVRGATRTFAGLREYAVSKLANVLFSAELGRRLPKAEVTSYALHPGVVASDAWRRIPWPIRPLVTAGMITNEEGAKTTLHCATSAEAASETGLYYDKSKPKEPSSYAKDAALAKELWDKSEEYVGMKFPA